MEIGALIFIAIVVVTVGVTKWRGSGQPNEGVGFLGRGLNLADMNSTAEANTKAIEDNTRAIRELIAKLDERKA